MTSKKACLQALFFVLAFLAFASPLLYAHAAHARTAESTIGVYHPSRTLPSQPAHMNVLKEKKAEPPSSTPTGVTNFKAPLSETFPFAVKLKMVYDRGNFTETEHCGGTVIGRKWVVTAAHCVKGPGGYTSFFNPDMRSVNVSELFDRIEVFVGTSLENPYHKTLVRRGFIHAGFDYEYLANDIAVLELIDPLPIGFPVAILDAYRRPSVARAEVAKVMGWPVTGNEAGRLELTASPARVHKVEWPGYITVTDSMGKAHGVCRGESGSPLVSERATRDPEPGIDVMHRQVTGILSGIELGTENARGEPCMRAGYEMYFTPVAAYKNWMDKVILECALQPTCDIPRFNAFQLLFKRPIAVAKKRSAL